MKAILYARFSPRRNADDCDSCEVQLADMRRWCEAEGHEVVSEIADKAFSGAQHDRPGLWEAIGKLKRGYLLVVRNVDRLSRDHRLSVQIEIELCKIGAQLASIENGGILEDSPEQELMRIVLGGLAQYQRKLGNKRTSSKMLAHQANGRVMGGVPFGKRRDENDPTRMVDDPVEQVAIETIRNMRHLGASFGHIANRMNDAMQPCRGKRWHPQTVKRICERNQCELLKGNHAATPRHH